MKTYYSDHQNLVICIGDAVKQSGVSGFLSTGMQLRSWITFCVWPFPVPESAADMWRLQRGDLPPLLLWLQEERARRDGYQHPSLQAACLYRGRHPGGESRPAPQQENLVIVANEKQRFHLRGSRYRFNVSVLLKHSCSVHKCGSGKEKLLCFASGTKAAVCLSTPDCETLDSSQKQIIRKRKRTQ